MLTQADINVLGFELLKAVRLEMESNPKFRAEVEELERKHAGEVDASG